MNGRVSLEFVVVETKEASEDRLVDCVGLERRTGREARSEKECQRIIVSADLLRIIKGKHEGEGRMKESIGGSHNARLGLCPFPLWCHWTNAPVHSFHPFAPSSNCGPNGDVMHLLQLPD